MHIKQVILDGFKSYGKRTVCGPFDEQFNAITGLNGSGKSNILDSICFVLGISKLAQVRVSNMQGLVYKNGQAGVTKASVTIVFDNQKPGGPLGYDQHDQLTVTRQVVIGGRNKYLINGHVVSFVFLFVVFFYLKVFFSSLVVFYYLLVLQPLHIVLIFLSKSFFIFAFFPTLNIHIEKNKKKPFRLSFSFFLSTKTKKGTTKTSSRFISFSSIKCQQPTFFNHARTYYQSVKHESRRDSWSH